MENLFRDYYGLNTFQESTAKVVVILGCGGTGSAFIRDAARLAFVSSQENMTVKLVLVDGDTVEERNITRQIFISKDVGKNKARVLAERYSAAFGIDIDYVDKYIENEDELYAVFDAASLDIDPDGERNVSWYIYSFVDNVKSRLMVHNFIYNTHRSRIMWVDTGNTEFAGQMVVSSTFVTPIGGTTGQPTSNFGRFRSRDVVEVRTDLMDKSNWDKFATELSCEEAAEHAPQTMAANTTAANLALNAFYAALFDKVGYIDYYQVTFNSQKNSFRTFRTYKDEMDAIAQQSYIEIPREDKEE